MQRREIHKSTPIKPWIMKKLNYNKKKLIGIYFNINHLEKNRSPPLDLETHIKFIELITIFIKYRR